MKKNHQPLQISNSTLCCIRHFVAFDTLLYSTLCSIRHFVIRHFVLRHFVVSTLCYSTLCYIRHFVIRHFVSTPSQGLKNIFTGQNQVRQALLLMNRHMTTAHSNEIDSQILIDQDPGSGSEIRDPGPRSGFF